MSGVVKSRLILLGQLSVTIYSLAESAHLAAVNGPGTPMWGGMGRSLEGGSAQAWEELVAPSPATSCVVSPLCAGTGWGMGVCVGGGGEKGRGAAASRASILLFGHSSLGAGPTLGIQPLLLAPPWGLPKRRTSLLDPRSASAWVEAVMGGRAAGQPARPTRASSQGQRTQGQPPASPHVSGGPVLGPTHPLDLLQEDQKGHLPGN